MCGIWKAGEATSCISGSCSLAFPASAEHSLNAIPSSAIGLDFGKQNNNTVYLIVKIVAKFFSIFFGME